MSKKEHVVFETKTEEMFNHCDQISQCPALEYASERISYLENLVKKYKYDYLTGLMMKQDFQDKFDRVFEEFQFADTPFCLALIDINDLHNINRKYGYSTGDDYIKKTAEQLKKQFHFHQIYRISGDEFAALTRCVTVPYDDFCERLEKIENVEFIAERSNGYTSPKHMFKMLDKKLTQSKTRQKRI